MIVQGSALTAGGGPWPIRKANPPQRRCAPAPNISVRSTMAARCSLTADKVADVTRHPAFREAARSIARLYDIAAAPENRELMTFASPRTGAPVLRAYQIPKIPCRPARAAAVLGEMGGGDVRPDGSRARSCRRLLLRLRGGAERVRRGRAEVCRQCGGVLRADARPASLSSAMRSCRRRSTAASRRTSRAIPTLYAGVVKERDDGIVISGAQQLATGGVLSDYDSSELHSPAAAGRRKLRQLPGRAGQRAGA